MSGVYVEAKFSRHLNACKNTDLSTAKSLILNNKVEYLPSKRSWFDQVDIWVQRARQRKQLAQLSQHLLDDIGLTEEMVAKEIAKPFWK